MENDTSTRLLFKFTKALKAGITSAQLSTELKKHPDYPSLLAFADVLHWFGIETNAFQVPAEELGELPLPFIAHTKNNGKFALVLKISRGKVTLIDDRRRHVSLDFFTKVYNGVVLISELSESSFKMKPDIFERLSIYRKPGAIAALALCFGAILKLAGAYSNLNWQLLALLLIKTAGLVTACLLLLQSIDKNNPFIQNLCGGGGRTLNCNAILTSKAATVFKGLTWSEVGFFYFSGTILSLLFASKEPGMLNLLALLNILSLPYTIYSVNYQARIAKHWCRLCITIQALLWLEFAIFLPSIIGYHIQILSLINETVIECGVFFAIPTALWLLVKPLLLNAQQLNTLQAQLHNFKYNKRKFESALQEQPKYAPPTDDFSIVLGNPMADTVITMVSNPYCEPCANEHHELDTWLNSMDDFQLRVVFTANNDDNDKKTPVARHLMALSRMADKSIVRRALRDWYSQEQKNYKTWAKAYPVTLDESKFNILEQQRAWCDMAEVKSTPTLLVNGYLLPHAYRVADIKYLLSS